MSALSAAPSATSYWPAPRPKGPVDATVQVPGSKSLTNRYLILAALADGPCRLRSPLHSRDSRLMIEALRALGARIEEVDGDSRFGADLVVHPIPDGASGDAAVDCGLAGTVMRFVPPLAALRTGRTSFDGDEHARRRPMGAVVSALRGLGVELESDGDALPFTVLGAGGVSGGRLVIDASQSSQFVSALLLVGARFSEGLHLQHIGGGVPSLDHIAMTVRLLRDLGVVIDDSVPNNWRVEPGRIRAFDVRIEPDLSNAGPFLAAAVATGGTVRMPHWPTDTTQVGAKWQTLLPLLGAEVELTADSTLVVRGTGKITGADLADTSELAPTVAALCALARTPSTLSGIAHLRGHETDRLAALVAEINRLGGDAEETADGLIIRPAPLHGGAFRTYDDHRMATAGAIIGLAVEGVEVENIATTGKTMPQFPELWQDLVASAEAGSTR